MDTSEDEKLLTPHHPAQLCLLSSAFLLASIGLVKEATQLWVVLTRNRYVNTAAVVIMMGDESLYT